MSLRTATLLGTVTAAAVAGAVFAQPEVAANDPREQLLEQIAALRTEGGPTAAEVIEPLRTLALVHVESAEHVLAIAALEDARHVTRVHQGLSSADEAVLLRQQLRSERALGDHARVWNLEHDMLTIARRHYDDIRMVPVFRDLADSRTDVLAQYRANKMPPEIVLGCYYLDDTRPYHDKRGDVQPHVSGEGFSNSCHAGGSRAVRARLRREILTYYADAIEVIVRDGNFASQELRDLERAAFRLSQNASEQAFRFNLDAASFACRQGVDVIPDTALDRLLALDLIGSCLGPVVYASGTPVRANVGGSVSLVRLIAYELRSRAPAAARAAAIAELADYRLVSTPPGRRRFDFSSGPTREIYERAYRETERDAAARASLFSPQVPVTLPSYEPNPFEAISTRASPRYIDVSFDITHHGVGEHIEILATSRDATRAEERDLIRLIESTTFRPRFIAGKLAESAPVTVRYHLGQ